MGRGTGRRRGPWGRAEKLTAALVEMVERKKFASGEVLGFDGGRMVLRTTHGPWPWTAVVPSTYNTRSRSSPLSGPIQRTGTLECLAVKTVSPRHTCKTRCTGVGRV